MSLGPVLVDVAGLTLTDDDRRRLRHPQVGGVILFSRNYQDPARLDALTADIHALREPRLLVTVDHEGGRVQRFRDGFQALPAMARLGDLHDRNPARAIELAQQFGWLMAAELRLHGVDLSFAPVLDLADPVSGVIGDRAFHRDPEVVTHLGNAWIRGMRAAGMEAVAKHFPGHGSVAGDSHHEMPFDKRGFGDIAALDLVPFRLVSATHLAGMMMAHVVYDSVDPMSAGYSRFWIETVLRGQLGFEGAVFSDDLSMNAAGVAGGYAERARLALDAGCDLLLVCNNPAGADEVLDSLADYHNPTTQLRLVRLHGDLPATDTRLSPEWRAACAQLAAFHAGQELASSGDLFD